MKIYEHEAMEEMTMAMNEEKIEVAMDWDYEA